MAIVNYDRLIIWERRVIPGEIQRSYDYLLPLFCQFGGAGVVCFMAGDRSDLCSLGRLISAVFWQPSIAFSQVLFSVHYIRQNMIASRPFRHSISRLVGFSQVTVDEESMHRPKPVSGDAAGVAVVTIRPSKVIHA